MRLGPILVPTLVPSNPAKPLQVKTTHQRHVVMFGGAIPLPMQTDVVEFSIDLPVMGATPQESRMLVTQLLELSSNAEWQRCGIYLTLREDYEDTQDGWYGLGGVDAPEDLPGLTGWLEAKVDVLLRARRGQSIGVYADQKVKPNEFNYSGLALVGLPQGVGSAFPAPTTTLAGADGNAQAVIEAAPEVLRLPFVDPTACMAGGRCAVVDSV